MKTDLFQNLQARGLLEQISDPAVEAMLNRSDPAGEPVTAYSGFDPTASSLHVGNLMPILGLVRLQRAGHRPIAVVGGATGLIGDPSGKSQERQLLGEEEIARNVDGIRRQLERFLAFDGPAAARLVNNADWLREVRFLELLRDVGKHFSVNAMIAKESVKTRLEEREQGISYTEFSYMILQAYDFLWLFDNHACTFQLGGSDQWGNITAGIELIRRKRQKPAFGFTLPLITTADGKKFGKSEAGNVWLDAERTSPYQFYQFFLNADDRDVGRLLRYFTFLPVEEIAALEQQARSAPEKREPQRVLAREVTRLVHGDEEALKAERAGAFLFGHPIDQWGAAAMLHAGANSDIGVSKNWAVAGRIQAAETAGAPTSTLAKSTFDADGIPLVNLLASDAVKLVASKGEARRQIEQGGIYLNEERITDPQRRVTAADLVDGKFLLLRKGKKSYHIVRVES